MPDSVPMPLMELRKRRNLSLIAVAKGVGVAESHISKIERRVTKPSAELANKLALYFDNAITRDQILFPEDYDAPRKKPVRSARVHPAAQEAR